MLVNLVVVTVYAVICEHSLETLKCGKITFIMSIFTQSFITFFSHFPRCFPAKGKVMSVYSADYGRHDNTTCSYNLKPSILQNTSCSFSSNSTTIVADRYSCQFTCLDLSVCSSHWAHICLVLLLTAATGIAAVLSRRATAYSGTPATELTSTWLWPTAVNVSIQKRNGQVHPQK